MRSILTFQNFAITALLRPKSAKIRHEIAKSKCHLRPLSVGMFGGQDGPLGGGGQGVRGEEEGGDGGG